MSKKVINVDHKIHRHTIFGQVGVGNCFGKTDYSYFCQSIVSYHTKMFKSRKVLRQNDEI